MAHVARRAPPLLSSLPWSARIGLGLAALIAALQLVNVARVMADPAGFAAYMGAPLGAGDEAWVQIYALRAAFIGLLVGALVLRRDVAALKWTALAALVMPLGDAWIAGRAGADAAIVGRHLATAAYVAIVFAALALGSRASDRRAAS